MEAHRLTALALFGVALVVITVFELVAGQSVSSITGGSDDGDTTIGQVGRRDSGGNDQQDPDDQPTESTSPSDGDGAVSRADRERFAVREPGAVTRRLDGPDRVSDADAPADVRARTGA